MNRILMLLLTAFAASLVSAGALLAQDDAVKDLKARIEQTRKMMDQARRDGNWEEFINLQKRLEELHSRLEGGGEGEKAQDDWAANLEKRLAGMDESRRVEALERLLAVLKQRGDHDRARLVSEMLGRHIGGRKNADPKKELNDLEKAIKKHQKEIEAAQDDFDFDRADKLRAELARLEARKGAILRESDKPGLGAEMERAARLKKLFEDLMKAGREGNSELAEKIKREIQEIKRGGEPKPSDWKAEAQAMIEKAMGQFKEWARAAQKGGDAEAAAELDEGVAHMKELWEAIERARTPEDRIEISRELLEAVEEIAAEALELRKTGKEGKARMVSWAAEQLKRVHSVLVSGGGPAHPSHEKAASVIAEIAERMETWARTATESGDRARADKLADDARNIRRFAEALRAGPTPEIIERLSLALNEGAERVRREIESALDSGDADKARMLEWVMERMRAARETLGSGLHPERAAEPWRNECSALVDEVAGRLDEMLRLARKAGGDKAVFEIEKSLRGVLEFRDALRFAGSPEISAHLLPLAEKGIEQVAKNLENARRNGDFVATEFLEWSQEKLRLVTEILRKASASGSEQPEAGARDKFRRAREEIARMMAEAAGLDSEGKHEKAEALRAKAEEIRRRTVDEMRGEAAGGRRGPEDRGPQAGPGRRGPGEERGQFGRKMRGLMEEMRKAEEQGDLKRLAELRARMDELKREMEGGRPERPAPEGAGPEHKDDRETERLRKELDSLRKELQELKKLLKELLKEKD